MGKIAVYDFFCGCGGTSLGFKNAGLDIVFALDMDPDAAKTFQLNFPETAFCHQDIRSLDEELFAKVLQENNDKYSLFCGCAPCQPFSKHQKNKNAKDERSGLLELFIPIIEKHLPDFVFIENVPGLQAGIGNKQPLNHLKRKLHQLNYHTDHDVVFSQDYGVAQIRRRFILVASRHGQIKLPIPQYGKGRLHSYKTVRDAIFDLPPLNDGEEHSNSVKYPNHRAARLSEINKKRIRKIPHDGGNRCALPEKLKLECHKKSAVTKTNGHTDVYSRLAWDRPAPGLTTRCISLSNGRYGHPEQDRAISVREAARIQGFPDNFVFTGNLNAMAKQIGNAVPVPLANEFGKHFLLHTR